MTNPVGLAACWYIAFHCLARALGVVEQTIFSAGYEWFWLWGRPVGYGLESTTQVQEFKMTVLKNLISDIEATLDNEVYPSEA